MSCQFWCNELQAENVPQDQLISDAIYHSNDPHEMKHVQWQSHISLIDKI